MRNVETVTITDEGRDKGKVFVLTEMPATVGKKWLTKLASAAGKGASNMALMALLDEPEFEIWRTCIGYQHKPNHPTQPINWDQPTMQIEEIATIGVLQGKVLEMHTGFFQGVSPSTTG